MQEIVIICIGSDMVSGDSLGPSVGSKLIEKFNINTYVYGKMGRAVNALNIERYLDFLGRFHSGCLLIAVDACLSTKPSDVGKIKISYKGIAAGLAVDKTYEKRIGDIGIIGIVGLAGKDNVDELLSVPFEKVDELANNIAKKINTLVNNRISLNDCNDKSALNDGNDNITVNDSCDNTALNDNINIVSNKNDNIYYNYDFSKYSDRVIELISL